LAYGDVQRESRGPRQRDAARALHAMRLDVVKPPAVIPVARLLPGKVLAFLHPRGRARHMGNPRLWNEPDGMARLLQPPHQLGLLVIEEEVRVEAPPLLRGGKPDHHRRPGSPADLLLRQVGGQGNMALGEKAADRADADRLRKLARHSGKAEGRSDRTDIRAFDLRA
ncbi:hypothetical protein DV959_13765, partial [Staphylococcus pseudintermedius]